MDQYKQEYEALMNHLDETNYSHFKSLESKLDTRFSNKDEKWSVLHDMIMQLYKSRGKTFHALFGDEPVKHAVKVSNSVRKKGVNYWKTVVLMNIYFIFFFLIVVVVSGNIIVSSLLVLPLLLSFIMVPFLNHGIKEQGVKKTTAQKISTILFLSLFILVQGVILFSFHDSLSTFSLINLDNSLLNMFSIVIFSLLTLTSLVFIVTSEDIYSRILFLSIGIYTFSWVSNQLNIWPSFTHFMLTYGMFIILPVVILTQFFRAKRENKTS